MNLLALQRGIREHLVHGLDDIGVQIRGDSAPRLAVYHYAYRAQLLACLRDTFEKTRQWLGDAAFDTAARHHVETHPPHSWTLNDYGDHFDQTLNALYPGDREVGELAWLDWALRRAFDGPDASPIRAEALADVDWDSVTLRVHPTLRVAPISTNCAAIWSAISTGEMPPAATQLHAPMTLRVWRNGLSPNFRVVNALEHHALLMAAGGASFATICAAIANGENDSKPDETAGALLAAWLRDGLIVAIE
jgi:hypothetical protein